MSIICCAPARFAGAGCPVVGSGTSPKCTAAVCASERTNAANDRLCDSSSISVKTRMVAYGAEMTEMTIGARFERLVEIMRVLRAPDGCPWDREQTLASLRPFVLEE